MVTPRPKCIVLPIQSTDGIADAAGLGLHFLLGNMMAAHPGLAECWFGWRVARIFPDRSSLDAFCDGLGLPLNLQRVADDQHIRFWVHGQLTGTTARLTLFDALDAFETTVSVPISEEAEWLTVRSAVLDALEKRDATIAVQDRDPLLWIESCDRLGLHAVGRALRAFYIGNAYGSDAPIPMDVFREVATYAPDAFIAHALSGWALYKNGSIPEAQAAFHRAIALNPSAVGTLAGLALCAADSGDADGAATWARRKANIRGEDPDIAAEKARNTASSKNSG